MTRHLITCCLFTFLFIFSCKKNTSEIKPAPTVQEEKAETSLPFDTPILDELVVYQSNNLIIQKLSDHVYEHVSFLNTSDYGKVGCNGMVVVNENEAVVFDTPTTDIGSNELIQFIKDSLKSTPKAIIPTHFHDDCLAGIEGFMEQDIPAYANNLTVHNLNAKNKSFSKPIEGLLTELELKVGDQSVYASFVGEGHTNDNIIGYYPQEEVIFGGCLLKSVDSGKGFLGDSNVEAWPNSIKHLRNSYPSAKIFIPGHGQYGGSELLDYTEQLFSTTDSE
ncbi:subclass B1 metallo-beta-lactamase [Aegicerativicinus sediminis]